MKSFELDVKIVPDDYRPVEDRNSCHSCQCAMSRGVKRAFEEKFGFKPEYVQTAGLRSSVVLKDKKTGERYRCTSQKHELIDKVAIAFDDHYLSGRELVPVLIDQLTLTFGAENEDY